MISTKIAAILVAAAFVSGAFISSPDIRAFAANTIASIDIINETIRSEDIKNGQVKTNDLGSGAVNSAKIKDGEVMTSDLADNAVTSDKLAVNIFDDLQGQIDALTAANSDQAAAINELTSRVEALEEGGTDPDPLTVDDDSDGFTDNEGDCDDANADVNPGAAEIPGNGIDDDCGGLEDEATASPGVGEVVINEVDYDSLGTDTAEFIELYNGGATPFDLNGLSLVRWTGTGFNLTLVTFDDLEIPAGGFVLVASNSHTGGLVTPAARFPDSSLVNTDGSAVQLVNGATILDAVQYGTGSTLSLGEGSPAPIEAGAFQSIIRFPNGIDTGDNSADFEMTTSLTPGFANQATS